MAEERPIASKRIPGPPGQGFPVAASMTSKEAMGILRRHIFLIFFLTMLGVVAGCAGWYLLQKYFPRYTSTTYIKVLPPVEKDPMDIVAPQTQKDIIYGYRQSIANLIKQQSSLEALLNSDVVKETQWFERRGRSTRKAVKYLNRYLSAYAHRDAEFVEVSMTCRDAREAKEIVDEMVRLFIAKQGSVKRGEVSAELVILEERQARVKAELDAADKGLDDVRVRWDITDLAMPAGRNFQHTITLKLNELELEKNTLELGIRQLSADIANLKDLATGPITEQVQYAIERDAVMVTLAQQLAFQEAQLSAKLTKFGENHRDVLQMREQIEEIKKRRELRKVEIGELTRRANLANARDGLHVLQERFELLEKKRQEAVAQKKDLDSARVQYDQRLKIRDERIVMLDLIKEQVEKLKMLHDSPDTPKVQGIGEAPIPLEMSFSRQWYLWFPGGTMLGLMFGVGLAFLIEMVNDLVRTPSDVARYLHIPLLGVIPDASEDSQVRRIELCHAVRLAPYSVTSESYRRCRTNLKLSGTAESLKSLLVSSGMAGDGNTSVAVNLAATFVAADKKVLLIDANFRQPKLERLFPKIQTDILEDKLGVEGFDFGLSSVLMKQCGFQEAIRPGGIEGLDIIDCGPLPANPAELLGSPRMEELLGRQRNNYDHIIIDGPPVLLVSDAKALARLVDTTVLVINAAATSRGAAQRTIREFKEVNAKIIGCVLFAARSMKGGYFNEQFKSYRKYEKKAKKARKAALAAGLT
ncbi:MAG: polysaccharide biosynthesis tyrosine autokinase [Planctomycetes bacterium]|nr:polysaccharide biosynthesis tyrosine autokinase [Planctomycetota bacterium]MBL7146204.1 polysaccharide biosynthesis tyrosine autokinase [Phycisphaerae bacterium]